MPLRKCPRYNHHSIMNVNFDMRSKASATMTLFITILTFDLTMHPPSML